MKWLIVFTTGTELRGEAANLAPMLRSNGFRIGEEAPEPFRFAHDEIARRMGSDNNRSFTVSPIWIGSAETLAGVVLEITGLPAREEKTE